MLNTKANWPGRIPAGSVVNQPLHVVDWYPTLLKLAGASWQQPLPVDGRDAWKTIASGKPSTHDEILLNATPLAGAIRRGDWKLVLNGTREHNDGKDPATGRVVGWNAEQADAVDRVELFNLAQDPYEKSNLADSQPEKVQELRARLDSYARSAAAPKVAPAVPGFKSPKVWGESD